MWVGATLVQRRGSVGELSQASTTVSKSNLSDQVADQLVRMIIESGLQPGHAIPTEAELTERFGVSRLIVREGIRILTAREILVSSQGRAATVRLPGSKVISQVLEFRLAFEDVTLNELLRVRESLEVDAVFQAAIRQDLEALAEAELALSTMSRHKKDVDTFISSDLEFHQALARASGNRVSELMLDSIQDLLLELRRESYRGRKASPGGLGLVLSAHQRILDAVVAGDAGGAAAEMRNHLHDTLSDLSKSAAKPALPGQRLSEAKR